MSNSRIDVALNALTSCEPSIKTVSNTGEYAVVALPVEALRHCRRIVAEQALVLETLETPFGLAAILSRNPLVGRDRMNVLELELDRGAFPLLLEEALGQPVDRGREEWEQAVAARSDHWVPAHRGTEQPFTKSGRRLLYCYNPALDKHAYVDLDTDMVLSDEESLRILGEQKRRPHSFRQLLAEALEGFALPSGKTQPAEGLQALQRVIHEPLAHNGSIAAVLAKANIEMHTSPDKLILSFWRDGQEVWRVDTPSLGDSKKLQEVLSSLLSLAAGKSPNARRLELERYKEQAKQANQAENQLAQLASRHTDGLRRES